MFYIKPRKQDVLIYMGFEDIPDALIGMVYSSGESAILQLDEVSHCGYQDWKELQETIEKAFAKHSEMKYE